MRYFIELSYRGTAYHGWQIQRNGVSVQEKIEAALSKLLRKPITVVGSGRTDSGVHARQQFAHFDVDEPIPLSAQWVYSLNSILPVDIAVRTLFPVRPEDHARFSAVSRYYQYAITRYKDAFGPGLTYHYRPALDIDQMNQACRILMRYTDFESFSKARADVNHFRCLIEAAYWERADEVVTFHIKANRFLWGMVRTIVGTMLEVGLGRMSLIQFAQIIEAKDRKVAGRAVPANGLYLTEVSYADDVLRHQVILE